MKEFNPFESIYTLKKINNLENNFIIPENCCFIKINYGKFGIIKEVFNNNSIFFDGKDEQQLKNKKLSTIREMIFNNCRSKNLEIFTLFHMGFWRENIEEKRIWAIDENNEIYDITTIYKKK
jgi:hypothetical protein